MGVYPVLSPLPCVVVTQLSPARVDKSVPKSAACPGLAEAGLSLPHVSVWWLQPGNDILLDT